MMKAPTCRAQLMQECQNDAYVSDHVYFSSHKMPLRSFHTMNENQEKTYDRNSDQEKQGM